jgi:hypothetical protein
VRMKMSVGGLRHFQGRVEPPVLQYASPDRP